MSSNITLIFDGDCGFCTTAANFIVKNSKTKIVAVPWQRTDLSKFSLTEAQVAMMSKYLRWFAAPTYRLVAKYRHKLPGGTPACKLPQN
ncbi:MAG: hypothetical protein EBU08_02135 [Micrococcales bacterium]|nr:hypothetical protein [Micrococcales bacterium]